MNATEGKRTIIRKTTKFIITNDQIESFTRKLQRTLPISPFKSGEGEFKNGVDKVLNNSVYFDSDDLCMYDRRVIKAEKSDLYRTRWYGEKMSNDCFFLERKRHRETHLHGKQSTKKRALMSSKKGEDDFETLSKYQTVINEKQLKPKVKTQYFRTSFMSRNMENVRVTLDENIKIINPNISGRQIMHELPFAVVEVKILFEENEQVSVPHWLLNIITSHQGKKLKFSKFNSGCMILYPQLCTETPRYQHALEEWVEENNYISYKRKSVNMLKMLNVIQQQQQKQPPKRKVSRVPSAEVE
eukprot:Pgem_evm1s4478